MFDKDLLSAEDYYNLTYGDVEAKGRALLNDCTEDEKKRGNEIYDKAKMLAIAYATRYAEYVLLDIIKRTEELKLMNKLANLNTGPVN